METNGIEIWNPLISSTISPQELIRQKPDKKTIASYLEVSANAMNEMRSFLMKEAFARRSEKELELLIESYQAFISRLLDALYSYHEHEGISYELKTLYEKLSEHLEDAMEFIETYFSKYFNLDEKVPNSYLAVTRHEIKRRLPELRKLLEAKQDNQKLINCILAVTKKFIEDRTGEKVTYRNLIFMKILLKELSEIEPEPSPAHQYSPLTALIIYLNFNDPAIIKHLVNGFTEKLSSLETSQEKIEELRLYHKHTSQMHIKPGVALYYGQPSVKEMILAWLEEEIFFWRSGEHERKASAIVSSAKIHTALSVPSLALFTRLFKDAGIVTNPNHAEILRFVSTHFTSQRKASISYGHLHSKFYQIEESTKRKVYDLLMHMAQLSKKMK
jgi:hypothetical protein